MTLAKQFRRRVSGLLLCFLLLVPHVGAVAEVVFAVNSGGEAHTDIHGIRYQKDPLSVGIASDYGKSLMIQRVVPQDQILYQTERYHVSSFGYDVPVKQDGDYVLVLKFCEVWFASPNQKVFDVVLNGEHSVVEGLDLFAKGGRGVAHDELVPFSVKGTKLRVQGEVSHIDGGKISVEFIKGDRDNPKINAMYLMRGTIDDVPKLPPVPGVERREPEDDDDEDLDLDLRNAKKNIRPSGPKVQDPYASDDTGSMMLPVVIAIGAFIPLLFCLCKL